MMLRPHHHHPSLHAHSSALYIVLALLLCINSNIVNADDASLRMHTDTACQSASDCPRQNICVDTVCTSTCTSDSQCHPGDVCRLKTTSKVCSKRRLFPDFTLFDGITSVVVFIGAMLAAGGGLGGGGIFVPSYIIITGLTAHQAVAVSQATIFGGAIVNLCFNVCSRHPHNSQRPIIDYDAVIILEPLMLAGTMIGVLANRSFPAWLIVGSLALILLYTTFRTGRRGYRIWLEERACRNDETVPFAHAVRDGEITTEGSIQAEAEEDPLYRYVDSEDCRHSLGSLTRMISMERNQYFSMSLVSIIFALVLVMSLLRGGKSNAPSIIGVTKCSPVYWVLTGVTFGALVLLTILCGFYVRRKYVIKTVHGYKHLNGDVVWSFKNTIIYPLMSIGAGVTGGLLGIGGGMIMGPLLLELGMLPAITSATSATTVLVTAASSTMLYVIVEGLLLDYGAWYFSLGLIGTFIGQSGINYLIRKYRTTSLIVFTIVVVLIISTTMLIVTGVINVIRDIKLGASMSFVSPCDN